MCVVEIFVGVWSGRRGRGGGFIEFWGIYLGGEV